MAKKTTTFLQGKRYRVVWILQALIFISIAFHLMLPNLRNSTGYFRAKHENLSNVYLFDDPVNRTFNIPSIVLKTTEIGRAHV